LISSDSGLFFKSNKYFSYWSFSLSFSNFSVQIDQNFSGVHAVAYLAKSVATTKFN
jgi:hypothetical protein